MAWLFIQALLFSVFLSSSSKAVDCSTTTVGLCDPVVEEIILDEVITEEVEFQSDGILTTTTTETTIQTTTVENEESGNILDSNNDFVTSSKDGEMNIDWGGIGTASMRSGSYCNELGTDRCAEITDGRSRTSPMGVTNVGTTFYQTVDISDLNIKYGGEVKYSIEVDKQDPQDSVYMHVTGRDGNSEVFAGTDILSASGTTSGFQIYENTFDFGGNLTTIIVEVGGRDIGISVGVLFDSVRIDVFYNTITQIISQSITSVEMFVALNIDAPEEVINVVENIFESNEPIQSDNGITFEPITIDEPTYETVEIEIQEIEIAEIEVEVAEIEMEIEAELEMPEPVEETPEEMQDEPVEETNNESDNDLQEETENEESISKVEENEDSTEDMEEPEDKAEDKKIETKENKKEEAAKKIVKKMGDKGKYDTVNQTKTLIVMQVLGKSKTFFESQKQLQDTAGFFTDKTLPDAVINDNDLASYFLFVGSDGLMNEMIEIQWQK
nr:putative carbohydrate binding domain containing protein [uncultured Mediterranean phage uvMED]